MYIFVFSSDSFSVFLVMVQEMTSVSHFPILVKGFGIEYI